MSEPLPPWAWYQKNVDDIRNWVYFVRVGQYIKIGYSGCPENRMWDIQHDGCAKPANLDRRAEPILIGKIPGTKELERYYHNRLRDWTIAGEWFAAHPLVLAYISGILGLTLDCEDGTFLPAEYTPEREAYDQALLMRALEHMPVPTRAVSS